MTDPCDHGTCIRSRAGRSCECEDDWQGDACDTNTNPLLAALEPSPGALWPAFETNLTRYSVDIGVDAPTITLGPLAFQPDGVSITVNQVPLATTGTSQSIAVPLNGSKALTVGAEADDGSTASYEVDVRRTLIQQAYIKPSVALIDTKFGTAANNEGSPMLAEDDRLYVGNPVRQRVEIFQRASGTWSWAFDLDDTKGTTSFGKGLAASDEWLAVGAADGVILYPKSDLGDAAPDVQKIDFPAEVSIDWADFNGALALTDEWLALGTPETENNTGGVHLFRLVNGVWGYHSTIENPANRAGDRFGIAVAMEGEVLVVGAPNSYPQELGAAYIFEVQADGWILRKTVPGGEDPWFAYAVAVSQGRVAVSSAYVDFGTGAIGAASVELFERRNGAWSLTATVSAPKPPDIGSHLAPNGFGLSMALDGDVLVVGAMADKVQAIGVNPFVDPNGADVTEVGAAYVFVESEGGWTRAAYLKASNGDEYDDFGFAVAVSGSTVAIAAPNEDSAATLIGGDQSDNSASNAGAVYVFGIDCTQVPIGADVEGC